jgi:hypothetical protein
MQRVAYATDDPAPDEGGRQAEQAILIELLRAKDGTRWTPDEIEAMLGRLAPDAMEAALERMRCRGIVRIEDEQINCPDSIERREQLDALAGVVVHVLVSTHPQPLAVADVAQGCERDVGKLKELEEIELALQWIEGDGLAVRQDGRWLATRPAVRADELSF